MYCRIESYNETHLHLFWEYSFVKIQETICFGKEFYKVEHLNQETIAETRDIMIYFIEN